MGRMINMDKQYNILMTIFLWFLSVSMVLPFIMMVIISFRPSGLAYKLFYYIYAPILTNISSWLETNIFFHGIQIR
jgi:ABC-type glycerol-3-phosphate transport system permease component